MSSSAFSYATIAASLSGAITVAFGINAILRPESGLQPFELAYPALPADRKVVDALMVIYGVRDVLLGAGVWVAAAFANRKTVGWYTLLIGIMAFTDGLVCKYMVGQGEWNHWGYTPMVLGLGIYMSFF
ncbi:hypothetical protein EJ05DRAFT_476752 [Pseudovirgaria hyperparasitica]|uniref:Uncharacterized protein n=1 Tax=Pseudovirgaria hyperparasitica TaxID=470096 RepID=A0A6A6W6B1_9PEZI|nr:uncharacterized protein EJ05DRAFT_476752 [Pseudovirgaria hyperparasitica]KAF2757500.1 hypothetical protein EJ05DRAFT_476752 [Pseudovirgaria hyperparasitica]